MALLDLLGRRRALRVPWELAGDVSSSVPPDRPAALEPLEAWARRWARRAASRRSGGRLT